MYGVQSASRTSTRLKTDSFLFNHPAGIGYYAGAFKTDVVGTVTIRVTLGTTLVSERNVTVVPGVISPGNCVAVFNAGVPVAVAGVTYPVAITAADTFGNNLVTGGESLSLTLAKTGADPLVYPPLDLAVTDQNDGTYTTSFLVTKSGAWVLTPATQSGTQGGFVATAVTVVAATRVLSTTSVSGVGTFAPGPFVSGVLGAFVITFRDQYGNTRYDSGGLTNGTLALTVVGGDGTTTAVAHSSAYHDETYASDVSLRGAFVVQFTPTKTGTLVISFVDRHGESLVKQTSNRPWTATVLPGNVDLVSAFPTHHTPPSRLPIQH